MAYAFRSRGLSETRSRSTSPTDAAPVIFANCGFVFSTRKAYIPVGFLLLDLGATRAMSETSFKHLKVRREQEVLVITIAVPFIRSTAFELVDALREELCNAIAGIPKPRVILDLSEIEFFGSAGIRPLLSLRRQVQSAGGQLILCQLSAQVEDVLRTTRLIGPADTPASAFDVASDVAAAVAQFAGPQ